MQYFDSKEVFIKSRHLNIGDRTWRFGEINFIGYDIKSSLSRAGELHAYLNINGNLYGLYSLIEDTEDEGRGYLTVWEIPDAGNNVVLAMRIVKEVMDYQDNKKEKV